MTKQSMYIGSVAGVSFPPAKDNLKRLIDAIDMSNNADSFKLGLVPDPANKYDANAIKVIAEFETEEYFVGWVPKEYNQKIGEQIQMSKEQSKVRVECALHEFNVFDNTVVGLEIDINLIRE